MACVPKHCLLLAELVLSGLCRCWGTPSRLLLVSRLIALPEELRDFGGASQVAWENGVGSRLWLKRTLTSHSIVTFDLKGLVPGNCACVLWSKFKLVVIHQVGKEAVQSKTEKLRKLSSLRALQLPVHLPKGNFYFVPRSEFFKLYANIKYEGRKRLTNKNFWTWETVPFSPLITISSQKGSQEHEICSCLFLSDS